MSDGLQVQAGSMKSDGDKTIGSAEDFLNEINNLRNNIEALMRIWNGPAASAFNSSFLEQADNLNQFQQVLNTRGENIVTSSQILNRNEEDLAAAGSHLF